MRPIILFREPFDEEPVLISSFMAARGRHHPMDLMLVQTVDETLCSFLSVGWGIIADTDIESEKLRSLGGNRFAVWFVARLISQCFTFSGNSFVS